MQDAFALWHELLLIDEDGPILGMALHDLSCPCNHSARNFAEQVLRDCKTCPTSGFMPRAPAVRPR
jgi:hypothetical protein